MVEDPVEVACMFVVLSNPMLRTATKSRTEPKVLKAILDELRLLRQEISLVLPQEDLDGYAHPRRIKRSYQKALKRYPPAAVWR